ncbi:MAG: hypothetical protein H6923_07295 [Alphaproteobacteria bacterium]|nr:hypothetical protein [Alphaproteobacteria bacterium]
MRALNPLSLWGAVRDLAIAFVAILGLVVFGPELIKKGLMSSDNIKDTIVWLVAWAIAIGLCAVAVFGLVFSFNALVVAPFRVWRDSAQRAQDSEDVLRTLEEASKPKPSLPPPVESEAAISAKLELARVVRDHLYSAQLSLAQLTSAAANLACSHLGRDNIYRRAHAGIVDVDALYPQKPREMELLNELRFAEQVRSMTIREVESRTYELLCRQNIRLSIITEALTAAQNAGINLSGHEINERYATWISDNDKLFDELKRLSGNFEYAVLKGHIETITESRKKHIDHITDFLGQGGSPQSP